MIASLESFDHSPDNSRVAPQDLRNVDAAFVDAVEWSVLGTVAEKQNSAQLVVGEESIVAFRWYLLADWSRSPLNFSIMEPLLF